MSLCVVISVDPCNASVLCLLGMSRGDYVYSIPELCIVMMACGIMDLTLQQVSVGRCNPTKIRLSFGGKVIGYFPAFSMLLHVWSDKFRIVGWSC